ncbi:hypothetical protein CRV02_14760 [Arcobacter sp. CECT 8989]|nr:hypothetical protein CRV02_14760 [Arcobacter sp. CECT 8989]
MMAFIHVLEHGNGIGKAIADDIFDALVKIGDGDVFKGQFTPDSSIKKTYQSNRDKNVLLGLFDDFIELGRVSKFENLGCGEAFLSNAIFKHPKLSDDGARSLYVLYVLMEMMR